MKNKEYIIDLVAEFLFKNNDEYGLKAIAREDAEKIVDIILKELERS